MTAPKAGTYMTETAPPASLTAHLKSHPRQESIHQHAVKVSPSWWNKPDRNLPGGPLAAQTGTAGDHTISRDDLFALANNACEDTTGESALRLLWHTLAWGTGTKHRNNKRRIDAVLSHPDGADLLRHAALLSRHDPHAAFALLRPGRANTFTWLGPNFFTKYIYFAGGGNAEHPCLIVDQFVRATLHAHTDADRRFRHVSQYSVSDYSATVGQLTAWAKEVSEQLGRPVAPDEVERWAFSA